MYCRIAVQGYRDVIKPMVRDTVTFLHRALQDTNNVILVEGANATMLDIDFGKLWMTQFVSKLASLLYSNSTCSYRVTLYGWITFLFQVHIQWLRQVTALLVGPAQDLVYHQGT